jgi:AcrR family transcriptional regulator
MSIREERRAAALARMGEHLLREGLAGASLRALAHAAGTSDRMLLYYFADKDEILTATLEHVAAELAGLLDSAVAAPRPYPALLAECAAAFHRPDFQPFMWLWLEIAAAAARGQEPHRAIAGRIADGFLAWGEARLEEADPAQRAAQAALLLATVDGLALLQAVGRAGPAAEALTAVAPRSAAAAPSARGRRRS